MTGGDGQCRGHPRPVWAQGGHESEGAGLNERRAERSGAAKRPRSRQAERRQVTELSGMVERLQQESLGR